MVVGICEDHASKDNGFNIIWNNREFMLTVMQFFL